jgi:hypothetical protein
MGRMLYGLVPRWLNDLERRMPWLGIPNLAMFLVGAQAVGFLLILYQPDAGTLLTLDPSMVLKGELWRLVTFLAVPMSGSVLWMVFVLWFLYFIVNGVEEEWGSFKATFYVLVCVLLTVGFAFALYLLTGEVLVVNYVSYLESTLFLAAAAIAPEYQILLFLVIPVKMKWLAWMAVAFIVYQFITDNWLMRLYLLTIYANYLLFFGPYHYWQVKQWLRRRQFAQQSTHTDDGDEDGKDS